MTDDLGPARTFFAFMEAVLASDLTPSQRLVLIVQAKHADAHDDCLTKSFPSEETLARETGLSTKTIERARKALVDQGWLVQTHSGRGASSRLSSSYDLFIPDDLIERLEAEPKGAVLMNLNVPSEEEGSRSNRHCVGLQTDTVSRQTNTLSQSNRHSVGTSTPSSTTKSSPATPPSRGGPYEVKEGTKDDRASSPAPAYSSARVFYWVGYSKTKPDGYFHRINSSTVEPKGSHVKVTLTVGENADIFDGKDYPAILRTMLDYAHRLGLRPPAKTGFMSRADRDKLYGLAPLEVIRQEPERQPITADDMMRRLIPSLR